MIEVSKIRIGVLNIIFAYVRWVSTLFSAVFEIMILFLKYKEGVILGKKFIKRIVLIEEEKVGVKKRYEEKC